MRWSAVAAIVLAASVAHAEDAQLPARVDAIRIEGLVRTKDFVVRRELGFSEGDVLTKDEFDLAIARLWNTTIFAHVEGKVVREDGKTIVILTLEDRWTLNPLFAFNSGGNAYYFRVGAADNNVAGRFLEAQAQYQNYDGKFHGGQAVFHDPRFLDARMDLYVEAERLVRPRPGFSDQRTQLQVEIDRLFDRDRFRIGLRTSAFANRFLSPLDGAAFYPDETSTLLFEPSLRIGRIDTVRLRQTGASIELRPAFGISNQDYAGATLESLAFAMLGDRWNIAVRVHGADVTQTPAHLQLYAGGLDLLRGFPDNYVRTRAFALANVEVRFVAFDSTWIALMPVVFADAIAAVAPSGAPGSAASAGAGLRVLVPKFVGTGVRADLAVPLGTTLRGVSEAEQARFGPATPNADVGAVQLSLGVYQFF
ncbi:MAG TPA: POTRA domain-containing protein [Labilithrix sp.]